MNRFFLDCEYPGDLKSSKITDAGDVRHISKVLRLTEGDKIEICFRGGRESVCEICDVTKNDIAVRTSVLTPINRELPAAIHLFQGLPKSKKIDVIIQKATECGVASISPVEMDRSVSTIKEKNNSEKLARLKEIAKSAGQQAKRAYIPLINENVKFDTVFPELSEFDLLISFDEEATLPLSFIENEVRKAAKIAIIIGPEGGISDRERELLKPFAKAVSLGSRILRTETASIFALSQLAYILESKR